MEKKRFKWGNVIIAALALLALGLFWWAWNERKKNQMKDRVLNRLTDENIALKNAYLSLLKQQLVSEKASPDVIAELEKIRTKVEHVNSDVHIELSAVIELVNQGMGEKAVKDLAKIIENLLKEKVQSDTTFTKSPSLFNMLDHAKNTNLIKPHEHAYGELLRNIRNRESHELNVKEEPYRVGLAIFSGIEIIYTLSAVS